MTAPIQQITLTRLRLPLKVPYKLALGTVEAFDTLIAEVSTGEEQAGLGEATVLTGYTTETIEDAWTRANEIASVLIGADGESVARLLESHAKAAPFTVCMFKSAIEMAEDHPVLRNGEPSHVPLLFGLNPTDVPGIEKALEEAFDAGYGTVKVKVGFDVEKDLERVAAIQRINAGRMKLRIDGNQGYSTADAITFVSRVAPDDIELLEQPCHMDDWDGLAEVARHATVPLMLDESIYHESDIARAADIGAAFVKLKLMKLAGIDALCAGLERIRALGMEPVLGNGVAGDIGCWMELCVAKDLIRNAGEMNGFLRPQAALVSEQLAVRDGCAILPARYRPALDRDAVDFHTVVSQRFS